MALNDTKHLTLRLPLETYEQVSMRKHRSLTGYIVEAVEEKLARDREEELRLGFASLAGTADDDSAAWIGAQRGSMGEVDA